MRGRVTAMNGCGKRGQRTGLAACGGAAAWIGGSRFPLGLQLQNGGGRQRLHFGGPKQRLVKGGGLWWRSGSSEWWLARPGGFSVMVGLGSDYTSVVPIFT